ncbi:MAG: extracellular solute-binding protein [Cohnella sp.]|nr:extracellular solute-binding protein [Cohnella sp.]
MNRKTGTTIALLLAISTVLAACGGNDNEGSNASPSASANPTETAQASEAPATEKVERFEVSLRHIQVGEAQKFRKAILDDIVDKVEAEIPGLEFELDGLQDNFNRFTKLPAEMAAGKPPKIFDLFGGPGDAIKYAKAGKLLDLTPIITELGIQDKFQGLSTFTHEGKVYGLPIGGSVEGLFYNKELFSANGVTPPKTWDELLAASETLKSKGVTPIAMGSQAPWVPLMLVNTLIGRTAGPDAILGLADGMKKWTDPDVVLAFSKYEELVKKGYLTKGELGLNYDQQRDEFLSGKAAMLFDGSWRSSLFSAGGLGESLIGKVDFIALPSLTDGKGDQTGLNTNFANGYGFSADLNDNELKAVKAFIKHMYTEEIQVRGLLEDGVLPSMKVSPDSVSKVENELTKAALNVLASSASSFPHFDAVVPGEVYKEVENQIQKLAAGKTDAAGMGEAIQKVADATPAQ